MGGGPEAQRLGAALGDAGLAERLAACGHAGPAAVGTLAALAEQAVGLGIDYRALGLGWHHPRSRRQYRSPANSSAAAAPSRHRAEASRARLLEALAAVVAGERSAEPSVVQEFLREIGAPPDGDAARAATFSGVASALAAELLLPLRALNEGGEGLAHTMDGAPLPIDEISTAVTAITQAVVSREGGFTEWRYGNPVGREQLRGLSERQLSLWRDPSEVVHARKLRTHEDGPGELGFFWATKIGGPSHGFDFEGQCILPLLANARHKVLLFSDPQWPEYPAGRAHWRLLWTTGSKEEPLPEPEPRLWLETVNCDFAAVSMGMGGDGWGDAALRHAMTKADAMQVTLSVDMWIEDVRRVAQGLDSGGQVREACERMLLRPSNGVVEASDYLGPHDWEQLGEEVTEALPRIIYVPRMVGRAGQDQDATEGYRVVQGTLFKKPSLDPATSKTIKLSRDVGSTVWGTGRLWTGPAGGKWMELASELGKPGWLLIEGPGFGVSGSLLEKV